MPGGGGVCSIQRPVLGNNNYEPASERLYAAPTGRMAPFSALYLRIATNDAVSRVAGCGANSVFSRAAVVCAASFVSIWAAPAPTLGEQKGCGFSVGTTTNRVGGSGFSLFVVSSLNFIVLYPARGPIRRLDFVEFATSAAGWLRCRPA